MDLLGNQFDKTVFIVSTGRTGTKGLAHYFDVTYPHVKAVHEPHLSRLLRFASNMQMAGFVPAENLIPILTAARRRFLARFDESIYIESNPVLQGFLPILDQVYRKPLIIHVVRDPKTTIPSAINFDFNHGLKKFANHWVPFWHHRPYEFGIDEKTWFEQTPVEKLSWYWHSINSHIENSARTYGDRYLRLRFEDLFYNDNQGLREMAMWIGLNDTDQLIANATQKKVNASTSNRQPKWDDWPESDRQIVLDHCGSMMERYGYSVSG